MHSGRASRCRVQLLSLLHAIVLSHRVADPQLPPGRDAESMGKFGGEGPLPLPSGASQEVQKEEPESVAGVDELRTRCLLPTRMASSFIESPKDTPSLLRESNRFRPYLEMNDRLRALLANEPNLKVASIVVVGDQSNGKTSVVEALSGVSLPRGEDIVTRCPLVLRILATPASETAAITLRYTPPGAVQRCELRVEDVEADVRRVTDELAPEGSISDKELELEIRRPGSDLDLTIVDLPGITRVAAQGQQEKIHDDIKAIYSKYMRQAGALILNVVTVSSDVSVCESLQLSRSADVDPRGERTVVVLSKADTWTEDNGPLLQKVLTTSKRLSIPHDRIFLVRCRTQKELNNNLSYADALQREAAHFKKEPFSGADWQKGLSDVGLGMAALGSSLVALQAERVRKTLTLETLGRIRSARTGAVRELRALPWPKPREPMELYRLLYPRLINVHMRLVRELEEPTEDGLRKLASENGAVYALDLEEYNLQFRDDRALRIHLGNTSTTIAFTKGHDGEFRVAGDVGPHLEAFVNVSVSCADTEHQFMAKFSGTEWEVENRVDISSYTSCDIQGTVTLPGKIKVSEGSLPLCALLAAAAERFDKAAHKALSPLVLLGANTHRLVSAAIQRTRGGLGLPDSFPPAVILPAWRHVLLGLKQPLLAFLDAVEGHVELVVSRVIIDEIAQMRLGSAGSRLAEDLRVRARRIFRQGARQTRETCLQLLAYDMRTPRATNHYYSAILAKLRAKTMSTESSEEKFDPTFEVEVAATLLPTAQKLREFTNLEQTVLDTQLKLFAAAKTIRKSFVDTVVKVAEANIAAILHGALTPLDGPEGPNEKTDGEVMDESEGSSNDEVMDNANTVNYTGFSEVSGSSVPWTKNLGFCERLSRELRLEELLSLVADDAEDLATRARRSTLEDRVRKLSAADRELDSFLSSHHS